MAEVRPFRAWRPAQGLAERIAALPYDVVNGKEAREETRREPFSFLAVDRPETQFEEENMDVTEDRVYERAGTLLRQWMKEGSLQQEAEPCYYIYELERQGRVQTGIAACVSVDDYLNGVIRRHENTRSDKEEDRTRHVRACEAQTGPVFLAYRAAKAVTSVTERCRREACLYDFASPDGISHRVWRIGRKEDIRAVHEAFEKVERLYIADGHHRCASAVRVAQECRRRCPDYTGEEPFNFILSVLFPDDQLTILEYNRVIRDLNGLTPQDFYEKSKRFLKSLRKKGLTGRKERGGSVCICKRNGTVWSGSRRSENNTGKRERQEIRFESPIRFGNWTWPFCSE